VLSEEHGDEGTTLRWRATKAAVARLHAERGA